MLLGSPVPAAALQAEQPREGGLIGSHRSTRHQRRDIATAMGFKPASSSLICYFDSLPASRLTGFP